MFIVTLIGTELTKCLEYHNVDILIKTISWYQDLISSIYHLYCHLKAYGVHYRNAKERYIEILNFQHFTKYVTFTKDGDDFRNKELRNKIEVSVVLYMECLDMFAGHFD